MQTISPMLWFDTEAEEAANHYVSIFSRRPGPSRGESRVVEVSRYGDAGPRPAGMVMVVAFDLEGQRFSALNGGDEGFRFSEAISFVVDCETQEEVDHFWTTLSEGGQEGPCGWLKDRYGVSWQIVPRIMGVLLSDPDREAGQRAMKAMLSMGKLDIAELRRAHDGP
jgi:predicted 3-demethylubiquinone-9 3-methyltransferase (glyoxalase superfamily)